MRSYRGAVDGGSPRSTKAKFQRGRPQSTRPAARAHVHTFYVDIWRIQLLGKRLLRL